MKKKNAMMKKLLSIVLCVAMVVSCIPESMMTAKAADGNTLISDVNTMGDWKKYFGSEGDLSTENAGGVWTDKSVLKGESAGLTVNTSDGGTTQLKSAEDHFLVALSAIGSNMTIEGQSTVPTDTMLVLDVSGSMNDNQGNNDVAEELVEAANTSIESLLTANKENRVGVVLYSGSSSSNDANETAAVLLLPLDRYTTDPQGHYLNYTDRNNTETISLNTSVRTEAGGVAPTVSTRSKTVVGATYIQKGVILAKDQFVAETNSITTSAGVKRRPVVVLMSDGAPTLGDTDFTNPGKDNYQDRSGYNMGDGSSSSTGLGFITQLSASYAKQEIETKYEGDCLFYTLGLGISKINNATLKAIATSVLDPKQSATGILDLWIDYNAAAVGDSIRVSGQGQNAKNVTKISNALEQNYVDRYVNTDTFEAEGKTLQEALKEAFAAIIADIELQATYFPTLATENESLSGYVSFVDKIGSHMEVTEVRGLLINNQLFSGADLASNFVANGGELGTTENPTSLGDEMVWAVMARMGLSSAEEARNLITLAYQNGQLSYTSDTEFSNYIGWYADASGNYVGFWDGKEEVPTNANAVYRMKSYGYLGQVDESYGVAKSDMMYATVRVREEIHTGEQMVSFAIPAALLPIVTYNVKLKENDDLENLTVTGAQHPIRLVYEVALRDEINRFNIGELLSDEYLAAHTDIEGNISFYTNQYETDNTMGYGKVNTYSYFQPSKQNDRYYFLQDSYVYTDDQGTYYEGTAKPSGSGYYRSHVIYKKINGQFIKDTGYHQVTSMVLEDSMKESETNRWYIPSGHIRQNYTSFNVAKEANNPTGTLEWSNAPFVDSGDPNSDHQNDPNHRFIVGATLGNNGKLIVTPETGIKISKEMSASAGAGDETFTFHLTNTINANDNNTYPTYKLDADGNEIASADVQFTDGSAMVELKAGEIIYIGGMTANDVIIVEEAETVDYKVESVNGKTADTSAEITIKTNTMSEAAFVNTERGKGNFTITKVVEHDFGTDYQIPADKTFTMNVTLSGIGTANATIRATQTNSSIQSITTDAAGKFSVVLKHNEELELFDLPEGTVVSVAEENPGTGFTAQYWNNGVLSDETETGTVTVKADDTSSIIVLNDYTPERVYPVNITVSGKKELTGREWDSTDSFTFELQKYIPATADTEASWLKLGETTVKGTDTDKALDFSNAFENEAYTAAGTYYYRVVEIEPETGAVEGVTYDKTVHSFAVRVTDLNMDGQLEIHEVVAYRPDTTHITSPVAASDKWNVAVDFMNSYALETPATVTIDLNKLIINESGSPLAVLSGYRFELCEKDDARTVVATSQQTTDRGFARLVLTYDEVADVGTHEYILREKIPADVPAGWTYSDAEIPITVEVTLNGANLNGVIYQGATKPVDAGTSTSATFTNRYAPDPAKLAIDFVSKELTGRAMQDGEFEFAVYNAQDTAATPTAILTGTNDANGNVIFNDVLTFDKVGTYFYNIVETSTDGNGVTTDKTVYRVTAAVTDGQRDAKDDLIDGGKLFVSYTLVNAADGEIVFKNTYTTTSTTHAISGTKTLTGKPLLADAFSFVMTEAVDAAGTVVQGAKSYTARNLANGTFRFPQITYSAAGTYYYLVEESKGGTTENGVQYDDTKHVVTVTVTDNLDGTLSAVSSPDAAEISFNNTYTAAPVKAQISGEKILDGKTLTAGAYEFELRQADANWNATNGVLETVSNAADGSFVFTEITYDKVGTSYYLVTEKDGGKVADGVTYDDSVFGVKVTVTDNLRGQLTATIDVYEDGIRQPEVTFVNIYEITGTADVTLSGTKTLIGDTLAEDAFTFELYEADSQYEVVQGASPIQTATNKNGEFAFDITGYGADDLGEHYYVVKEADSGEENVTYSTKEYHILVTVEDNGTGSVTAAATEVKHHVNVDALDFTNFYYDPEEAKDVEAVRNGTQISVDGQSVEAGETITYVIDWINTAMDEDGNPKAATITIKDEIPENTSFDSASGSITPTVNENGKEELVWTIHAAPKAYGTVSFKVTVDPITALDGDITNTAKIKVGNNAEITTNTTENYTPQKTVQIEDITAPKLNKEATFTISWKNITDQPSVIVIEDILDTTLTYVQGSAKVMAADGTEITENVVIEDTGVAADGRTVLKWTLSEVAANTSGTVTFQATLNENALTKKTENEAEVKVGDHDPVVTNKVEIPQILTRTLEIGKTVELTADQGTVINDNQEFTFKITLKDTNDTLMANKTFAYKIYDKDNQVAESGTKTFGADGSAQLKLKHQQRAEILELPEGTKYTVEEIDIPAGYAGEQPKSGVIFKDSMSVAFVNVYTVTSMEEAVLEAKKTLNGPDGITLADQQFDFTVHTDAACTSAPVATGKNNAEGKVTFTKLTFSKAGEHIFYMKEVNVPAAEGYMEFDTNIYKVTVQIKDDLDGTLSVESVNYTTVNGEAITDAVPNFINKYKDGYVIGKFDIQAKKILEGSRQLEAGEFSFEVLDAAGNRVAVVTNDAEGNIIFSDVVAAAFLIEEEATEETAEETVEETAEETVEETAEETVEEAAKETAEEAAEETAEEAAKETAEEAAEETAEEAAEGTVEEAAEEAAKETAEEAAEETVEDAAQEAVTEAPAEEITGPIAMLKSLYQKIIASFHSITSITAQAKDKATIHVPENASTGTYEYTIKEIVPEDAKQGITYSQAVYKVKVEVINDNGNVLVSEPVYYMEDGVTPIDVTDVKFENKYKAEKSDDVIIQGSKVLTGRDLKADEFTFVLSENGTVLAETTNTENGEIKFTVDGYSETGSHEYVITEKKGNTAGISYSEESVLVTVAVTDDGTGKLKAEVQYPASGVVFHNEYAAAPTDEVIVEGSKVLTGRKLQKGEFTFTLTDEEGNVLKAKNNAKGVIEFNLGSFDKEGTYKYKIKEVKGNDKNITYSKEVYTVTVKVTDDGNGKLKATVQYSDDVVFHNNYTKPVKPQKPEEPTEVITPTVTAPAVSPKTGDVHNIIPMLLLGAASVLGMTAVVYHKKRSRKQ